MLFSKSNWFIQYDELHLKSVMYMTYYNPALKFIELKIFYLLAFGADHSHDKVSHHARFHSLKIASKSALSMKHP